MAKEYALYQGEELMAIGTIAEISEQTGISKELVRFYGNPSHKRRSNENTAKWLVKIDEEGE